MKSVLAAVLLVLISQNLFAGQFSAETCKSAEGLAKRVYIAKSNGMTYKRYLDIEGTSDSSPQRRMSEAIERGIFLSGKVNSVEMAGQFGFSTCITWN